MARVWLYLVAINKKFYGKKESVELYNQRQSLLRHYNYLYMTTATPSYEAW